VDQEPIKNEPDSEPAPGLPKKRQVIHIVILDVVILMELGFAVHMANSLRETYDFTLVFCAVFFGLIIPTIWLSRFVMRRLTAKE